MRFVVGCDLVDARRIVRFLEKPNWKDRIFTTKEQSNQPTRQIELYYAKRWAAKEAFFKATNFFCLFTEISILNMQDGRPYFEFSGKVLDFMANKEVSLSLSDEFPYASAVVFLDNKCDN